MFMFQGNRRSVSPVRTTNVQVRIDAQDEAAARRAATEMGVNLKGIYPKRNGRGVLAYGWRAI
jgi:hypothetical protein